jgi:prepilin-type N-terminal cleavage/methylation domain-containing protein
MNNAIHIIRDKSAGFTLVEIMIVVAIIALLAAIAVPNFQRARKRGQAVRILNDLRIIDYAIDRWAIENNKAGSDIASFTDIRPYLKTGTQLYNSGTDLLGHTYGSSFTVDTGVKITDASFNELSDVAPAEFWSPFK